MDYLYYDTISKVFSLKITEGDESKTVFLGPLTNTKLMLESDYDLTQDQAQEATLQAMGNGGDAVSLTDIKRSANFIYIKQA